MCLEMNVILSSQKYIKTVIFSENGMIRFSITTAQTIILKSNRKMGIKNTVNVKNIVQIQSFKWECLWTETESLLPFHYFPGNANEQTSLKPLEAEGITGLWMYEIYLLQ